jgi:hypothetical protein
MTNIENLNWSSWLDFNKDSIISNVPESEGVYKMHASMKILYIGNSNNIRQSLLESLENSCIKKDTTRFSYAITDSSDKIKEFLLDEYRNKHNDKLPICMEK